jgi:Mn2+/Fe2+ NRAMP family transporter
MKKIFQVALGILAAIGGFVDIGDLVFNVEAGATLGYQLLWVIVVGVVGIIVYSEMCGRVAAVARSSRRRS